MSSPMRSIPFERRPGAIEILRNLAGQREPLSIKTIAENVTAAHITTRNRLIKLDAIGAVREVSAAVGPGFVQATSKHYVITSYGRDCVDANDASAAAAKPMRVNSIFALAAVSSDDVVNHV